MKCLLKSALLTFVSLSLFACAKGNDTASNIDPRTGKHPSDWAVANTGGKHPEAFLGVPGSCYECHGKDLKGGISAVSCFTASRSGMDCHAGGPSGHPAGWAAPDVHGKAAKSISAGLNGYAHCQVCHGVDFSGGNAKKSCLNTDGCHGAGILAPHSAKPWRDVAKTGTRSHASTDSSNAAACAVCHAGGANSTRTPTQAAPSGTAPGCFNNTLCHGVEGHATGWKSYSSHGRAAKAAAGGITINGVSSPVSSFRACIDCHGAAYDGGIALQTCLNTAGCHGADVAAPHPASPWRSLPVGVTHTTTDTGNAGQCAVCHTTGANSTRVPRTGDAVGITGCFNNSLCHGAQGHAAGWSAAARHGAAAKGVPSSAAGFASCQLCHGVAFNSGPAPSCRNVLGCHGLLVSSPHPAKPWSSSITGTSTHTDTDPANAGVCAACHTGGANSAVVPPNPATGTAGCYNNTLCHFHQIPFAPPTLAPAVHGGLAKQDLRVCQACHGVKGSTKFDGLTLAGGVATIACSSCHAFAKAHPTDWQGSGTYSHRTAGNTANACTLCHDVTLGQPTPLTGAPSCFSATFANQGGLGQTRTCHPGGVGSAPHVVPYPNHNATARSNFNYCLGCHQPNTDVTTSGGKVIPRCQTCHLSDPTVTSTGCTSCHARPPNAGGYPNIAGSHSRHSALNVAENVTLTAGCDQCHSGLGFGTLDHLERARLRASVPQPDALVFGALAKSQSTNAVSCVTSWCHGGNTALIPQNIPARTAPVWGTPFPGSSTLGTGGVAGTSGSGFCAQCHGYPPLTAPHAGVAASQCNGCHAHLNTDGLTFNDPTRHVNGSIDASGAHAFPNPGSAHKAAANGTGCRNTGCHPADVAGSSYPVASGTPPNCRACHLNNSPAVDPRCSDCHGSAGNDGAGALLAGRPASGGATFPNRPGEHNRSQHVGRACTVCHPFTSGDSRHGWSNRQKSTAAQVGGAGTSINSWNPVTKSCLPTCHGTETW